MGTYKFVGELWATQKNSEGFLKNKALPKKMPTILNGW